MGKQVYNPLIKTEPLKKDREIVQVNSESTLNELRVGNYAIWADLEKLINGDTPNFSYGDHLNLQKVVLQSLNLYAWWTYPDELSHSYLEPH